MTITADDEKVLLEYLFENGISTAKQLEESLDSDTLDETDVVEWAEGAEDRELVERVVERAELDRWQITDEGRAVIGKSARR